MNFAGVAGESWKQTPGPPQAVLWFRTRMTQGSGQFLPGLPPHRGLSFQGDHHQPLYLRGIPPHKGGRHGEFGFLQEDT